MPNRPKLPTEDDLKKLPLGAIVAYAVRCARRVQPLYGCAAHVAELPKHEASIEGTISLAEKFCLNHEVKDAAYGTAYPAMDAADSAAAKAAAKAAAAAARAAGYAFHLPKNAVYDQPLYAGRVATEAVDGAKAAARAAGHAAGGAGAFAAAAQADFDRLLQLKSGSYPKLGQPIDPTENGPLGPLWPAGEPDW